VFKTYTRATILNHQAPLFIGQDQLTRLSVATDRMARNLT
jgi:hypothetical protein